MELSSTSATYKDTERIELEDQFIIRLPKAEADYIRCILETKPKKIKKKVKLDVDPEKGEGVVIVGEKSLKCRLRKLPTIIESLKTYNKTIFVKTADIVQILDCVDTESGLEMAHGLTPPMKNAKNKRFRKCLINRDEASVNVQKELFYLLQADLEAVSTKFEFVSGKVDEGSPNHKEKSQVELFGNISTDSEESESNMGDIDPFTNQKSSKSENLSYE